MKNNKQLFLLLLIFAVAFFLRFYKLGDIPRGLYQDETAIGYNAYSILKTGKDEYGKVFPLYFKSFGDYKLPVYIYSTIIPIQLFGLTAFAVRFPSAFFGFLTVIIFYFFTKDLTKNKTLSIIATSLLAVNPWHLHYNRATFEVSIALFFFILGGYLLNIFFRRKIKGAFLFGAICFIISFYSYNLTRVLSPLLFGLFLFYNRRYFAKAPKREMFVTLIFAVILFLPFVLTYKDGGGAASASGTLIFTSAVVQAPLHEFRAYANMLPAPLPKIFFNNNMLTLWQFIENIISYFSVSFFFITGSIHGNHGIGDVGLFYLFECPFIIWGISTLIKKKMPWKNLLFSWAVIVILIAALTRDIPHATRSFFLIMPFEILSAYGLIEIIKWIYSFKNAFIKYSFVTVGGVLILFNLVFYFTSYYERFPLVYAKQWRLQDEILSDYLKDHEKNYTKILFDKEVGFMYTSLLFYLQYPPDKFQNTVKREKDNSEGFSDVTKFGKYEFRILDWGKDMLMSKTLIVSAQDKKSLGIEALKTINYPKRTVVYASGQQLYEVPVEDSAYVLVKTK